jgi:DHA2 family methylenomycin A resistance protein-like MFS transporter
MASGLVNMGRLIGATLGVAVLGVLFGAQAATSIANVPQFLRGLHGTFVMGGIAELAGAAVALFCLRADSLETPKAADAGQNGNTSRCG